MPITIVAFKDISPNSTETITWTAPRDGKIVKLTVTFYETEELLRVYITLNGTLNVITFATGGLQYLVGHNQTITIHCDKQFGRNDVLTIKGENIDTDPQGMHRLRVLIDVELL